MLVSVWNSTSTSAAVQQSDWKSLHTHYCDVIMGAIASRITSLAIVDSTVYSGADQRKHLSSASLAFVRGIHRWPVNSPHKWPVTRKIFPFDDVIMYVAPSDARSYDNTSYEILNRSHEINILHQPHVCRMAAIFPGLILLKWCKAYHFVMSWLSFCHYQFLHEITNILNLLAIIHFLHGILMHS